MTLREQINKERIRQKKTPYRLAKETGTDQSHIKKLEDGIISPRVTFLSKICNALGVSIKFMPDGSTIMKKEK